MKPFEEKPYLAILAGILTVAGSMRAAPSLPVTKVPATPNPSYTGPTNDAHAIMGQWFMNVATGKPEYRTHEFYDNPSGSGGGAGGHLAISGVVTNVNKDFFQSILSFDVIATVWNDSPASNKVYSGTNSHGETLTSSQQYTNALKNVILTADFASANNLPDNFDPPYRQVNGCITATDPDFLAWYCWNKDKTDIIQPGDFHVPGWNFGDIAQEMSSTRTLHFVVTVDGFNPWQISNSDPRYAAITNSEASGADIFINRSLSLKISEWISDPAIDEGDGASTNSNVSVFHNTAEDENQVISISGLQWQTSPPGFTLSTTGSTNGIGPQILQASTNLLTTNWLDVATNPAAWPIPQTNVWTNATSQSPIQFFRIIQQSD